MELLQHTHQKVDLIYYYYYYYYYYIRWCYRYIVGSIDSFILLLVGS